MSAIEQDKKKDARADRSDCAMSGSRVRGKRQRGSPLPHLAPPRSLRSSIAPTDRWVHHASSPAIRHNSRSVIAAPKINEPDSLLQSTALTQRTGMPKSNMDTWKCRINVQYDNSRHFIAITYRTFESHARVPPKPAPTTDHQASTRSNSPHYATPPLS